MDMPVDVPVDVDVDVDTTVDTKVDVAEHPISADMGYNAFVLIVTLNILQSQGIPWTRLTTAVVAWIITGPSFTVMSTTRVLDWLDAVVDK